MNFKQYTKLQSPWYRTDDPSQPTTFDLSKTRSKAVYLTDQPEWAEIYAHQYGVGIKPREFRVDVKNPATAEDLFALNLHNYLRRGTVSYITPEEVDALKQQGFDSIMGRSSEHPGTDIAVFDPSLVKLIGVPKIYIK